MPRAQPTHDPINITIHEILNNGSTLGTKAWAYLDCACAYQLIVLLLASIQNTSHDISLQDSVVPSAATGMQHLSRNPAEFEQSKAQSKGALHRVDARAMAPCAYLL